MSELPPTYSELESVLIGFGFARTHSSSSHTTLAEPSTGSQILLPPHKPADPVPQYTIVQVRRTLADAGIVEPSTFAARLSAASAWKKLTGLIADEFWRNGQDPGAVFEPDAPSLKLRARIKASPDEWYVVTLTPDYLETQDLDRIAHAFVEKYRKARIGC